MSDERAPEGDSKDPASSSSCSNSYEFSHAAAKVAVAQVCESVGYEQFKDPALESLARFAVQYILQIGKTATSFANLTGRSQCNVFDIALALEDLNSSNGVEKISSESCSVVRSVKLSEIIYFVNSSEEIPFIQPLPRFPVAISDRSKKMIPSFDEIGETPPGKHIPLWLPAFPDPHTYKETPMWIERASDPRGDKIEQARQRRKAERALLSLQRKLVCKISSGNHVWGDMDTVKEEIREAEDEELRSVSPSISGEKVESLNRDGLSVIEAFGPAMEAARDGFCSEAEAEWKKKKPVVLSKLRTEKKFLGQPLELSLLMKGEDRPISFVREEDRDDKRRRAEFILRQCMENPVDLNQM